MSMTTLVILRFAGIFAAYTGLTVLLPAIMFRRVLAGRGLSEQFLMCYTFGNFYIINIVFAVQLLHISGFWALVLFTAVPGILIWSRVNMVSLRELCIKTGIICKKILQGSMGMRGALYRVCNRIKAVLKRSVRLFYYNASRFLPSYTSKSSTSFNSFFSVSYAIFSISANCIFLSSNNAKSRFTAGNLEISL